MSLAKYREKIEISSLWSGKKHIVWKLRPDVNVLSGKNGAGKSTILNRIVQYLHSIPASGEISKDITRHIIVDFYPEGSTSVRYDIIRSFDRRLLDNDRAQTITDQHIETEMDWQLYQLQRRYLDYQVNIGNRMISFLSSSDENAKEKAQMAAQQKHIFLDMVDKLFAETGKTIDRNCNELQFIQYGEPLSPYFLSSGEKQILVILLTALTEDMQPYVFFMDEPEASLHFEWQKDLIDMVRKLNPNAQIILTTHSPAVIMNGWEDAVTEVGDITQD